MTEINFLYFGQVQWLMFVGVNFSVMFNAFGHIHSVILNRSSDYSSHKFELIFWQTNLVLSEVLKCPSSKVTYATTTHNTLGYGHITISVKYN